MTFDDFKAQVSARWPNIKWHFDPHWRAMDGCMWANCLDASVYFKKCRMLGDRWCFTTTNGSKSGGDTLEGAIAAHIWQIRTDLRESARMGLVIQD